MGALFDPPEKRDPTWIRNYGRAEPGEPICGVEIIKGHPDLICTRPPNHAANFHIAHTIDGLHVGEVSVSLPSPPGRGFALKPWEGPYPTNIGK